MPPCGLLLAPEVLAELLAHARAHGEREFVGALGGSHDAGRCEVNAWQPLPNVAVRADAFAVDGPSFAAAESALRARGHAWLGFVHSHPRGAPAPSPVDQRDLWRDCVQLIVAGDDARAFWFTGERCLPLPLPNAAGARS